MTLELEENQCHLWKRVGKDKEHYIVAIPSQHWTRGMDEMKFDTVETVFVPSRTRFTKIPTWNSQTSKEKMIKKLRKQKEYWISQMHSKIANQMNYLSSTDQELDVSKNTESYYRYQKRVEACCKFLDALQEEPPNKDLMVDREKYGELDYDK